MTDTTYAAPRHIARRLALAGALAMALSTPAAFAQSTPPAPSESSDSRHEHGKRHSGAPELTLQANASREVKQDTVTIVVEAQVEAANQAAAGKQLTSRLDSLVKRAKADQKNMTVTTGNYRVYAVSNDKGKTTGWQGRGELRIESKDFAAASALASKLSDASAITSVRFSLSREAREAEEKRLLVEAAKAFQDRALAAANAFGFTGYRMGKLTLGGAGGVSHDMAPAPYMMSAMARKGSESASPDVPLEPDNERVVVDVSGSIYMQ